MLSLSSAGALPTSANPPCSLLSLLVLPLHTLHNVLRDPPPLTADGTQTKGFNFKSETNCTVCSRRLWIHTFTHRLFAP